MDEVVSWVFTTVIGLMIGALGFFIKHSFTKQEKTNEETRESIANAIRETREDFQAALNARDQRMEKLENKLNDTIEGMPYKYTLRDDFIRAMGGVDTKLNKILDKLSGLGGQ